MRAGADIRKPPRAFKRALLVALGIVLYVAIAGAIATYAVGGGRWFQPVDIVDSKPRTTTPVARAAPIVVSITILDGECPDCLPAVTVDCTTTADRVSVDSILIPRTDFAELYSNLGCN